MIVGIGTDIIEINRIENKLRKGENFKHKIFSENEILYCEKRENKFESYAVRFAAKEAFLKALGIGIFEFNELNQIEIITDQKGKPSINLNIEALKAFENFNIGEIHLSLSHSNTHALAFVVINKKYE